MADSRQRDSSILNVRLSNDEIALLKAIGELSERSAPGQVRFIVREWLKHLKKEQTNDLEESTTG